MRNMSFALTTPQFLDGSKDITRRFGWRFLKSGDRVRAVEKGMGIPKGEKIKSLGVIEIVSIRQEPLNAITQEDCIREGFPDWSPEKFISFIMVHYGCKATDLINRIEFKRIQTNDPLTPIRRAEGIRLD